jgi:hypothetical protein
LSRNSAAPKAFRRWTKPWSAAMKSDLTKVLVTCRYCAALPRSPCTTPPRPRRTWSMLPSPNGRDGAVSTTALTPPPSSPRATSAVPASAAPASPNNGRKLRSDTYGPSSPPAMRSPVQLRWIDGERRARGSVAHKSFAPPRAPATSRQAVSRAFSLPGLAPVTKSVAAVSKYV